MLLICILHVDFVTPARIQEFEEATNGSTVQ